MKNRIVALILVLVMMVGCLPSHAETETAGEVVTVQESSGAANGEAEKPASAPQAPAPTEEKTESASQVPAPTEEKTESASQAPAPTEEKTESASQAPAPTEEKTENASQAPAPTEEKTESVPQAPAPTEEKPASEAQVSSDSDEKASSEKESVLETPVVEDAPEERPAKDETQEDAEEPAPVQTSENAENQESRNDTDMPIENPDMNAEEQDAQPPVDAQTAENSEAPSQEPQGEFEALHGEGEEDQQPAIEADDFTKFANEKIEFTKGYAMLKAGSKAYEGANDYEAYAQLSGGVVYAVSRSNAGEKKDRLKVALADEDGVLMLFVSASDVRPMSEKEINEFILKDEKANIETEHSYNHNPVSVQTIKLLAEKTGEGQQNENAPAVETDPVPETPNDNAAEKNEPAPAESEAPATETEPAPTEPEAPATETEPAPAEPEALATETEPAPTEPEAPATETEPTPVEPEVPATETEPTPAEPEAPATETEPTPAEPEAPATETEPTPVEPEVPATETEPTPVEPEVPATETEPTPAEPEAPATETESTPAEPEVLATDSEPTPVEPEAPATETEPAPAEPEVPATETEPTPAEPEVPATDSEPTPVEPEVPATETEPTPAEPEVPATDSEPTPVEPEVLATETEPTPAEPEVPATETEPTPAEPEAPATETEPVPVEPEAVPNDDVEYDDALSGFANAGETAGYGSGEAYSVDISHIRTRIGLGEAVKISADVRDVYDKAVSATVTYASSAPEAASIDADGTIRALSKGKTIISAETANGIRARIIVEVVSAPSIIEFAESSLIMAEASTCSPAWSFKGECAGSVEWYSANTDVVTVSQDGVITAVGAGSTAVQIRAYNGVFATCSVSVMAEPTDIIVSADALMLDEGQQSTLYASFSGDAYGVASFEVISGTDVVELETIEDNAVVVKALRSGEATILASIYNAVQDKTFIRACVVTVNPTIVKVEFLNPVTAIGIKETIALQPVAYDGRGNAVATEFKYATSASKYVSLKGTNIYGVAKGSSTITVSAENGVKASIKVTAANAPSKVSISVPSAKISVGQSMQLSAWVPSGQAGTITWTSENTLVLDVSPKGEATAVSVGTTRVCARTYNGVTAFYTVSVVNAPESISFEKESYKVCEGLTVSTVLNALPEGSSNVAAYEIFSAGEETVATVDANGVVKGVSRGTATLRATVHDYVNDKDVTAECEIIVILAPVRIAFGNTRTKIGEKETMYLEPVAYDAEDNPVDIAFSYATSASGNVSLKNGGVYGNKTGSATITVTAANGVKAAVKISTVAAPSKVYISAPLGTLCVNQSMQMSAAVPSNQAGKITWLSEDESVLSVDQNGFATALSAGTTRVRAQSYNGKFALFTVTVQEAPKSISFAQSSYTVQEGLTTATAIVSDPVGAYAAYTYEILSSGEEALAEVDAQGVVKGLKRGTATLRATVHDYATGADITADCAIEIILAPATIALENERRIIGEKETMFLSPVAYDAEGNVVETTFKYASSAAAKVKISGQNVYGAAKGSATVTITAANGVKTSVIITVATAPSKVYIASPAEKLPVGSTMQMKSALPSGQAGLIRWTSESPEVLSVDENGFATALSAGVSRVRVDTYNGKSAACYVTVTEAPQSLTFENAKYEVGEGASVTPALIAQPADAAVLAAYEIIGNTAEKTIAEVTQEGKVNAKQAGTVTLRATVYNAVLGRNITAECEIEVVPAPVTIAFANGRRSIGYKETVFLNPVAYDVAGNEVETEFAYATSAKQTVQIKGVNLYGAATGSATITVTAKNGVKASVKITVTNAPDKVSVSAPLAKLPIGESMQMRTTLPSGQAGAVTWSVDNEEILKVDANGVVTALAEGAARVTARTYNGKTSACWVAVAKVPESIAFAESKYVIGENASISPALTALPEDAAVFAEYEIIGNTEEAVYATVSENGTVTGKLAGTVTLRATVYNRAAGTSIAAETQIEVVPAPVTIVLQNGRRYIGYKELMSLDPVAYDASGNVIETIFRYTTSASANVSLKSGGVYGAKVGAATITVIAENGASTSCKINVTKEPDKVYIASPAAKVPVGETVQMSASLPSGANGRISWSSLNAAIATVDENGLVTAVSAGSVVIRATAYNGKYAQYTLTVAEAPEAMAFEQSEYTLSVGMALATSLNMQPEGAYAVPVYAFTDDNEEAEVISVDASGKVTGLCAGTARLTATYERYDGAVITAECDVVVKAAPASILLRNDRRTIGYKELVYLDPVALDADGNEVPAYFSFATSAKNNVSIKGTGVYGAAKGASNVTISAHNGVKLTIKIQTVTEPNRVYIASEAAKAAVGETVQMQASLPGGQAGKISWLSLNNEVATVDENGLVTCLKAGQVNIRAAAYNGKNAQFTLTVTEPPTAFAFEEEILTLSAGMAKQTNLVMLPEGAYGRAAYTFTNEDSEDDVIAVDANGRVTALKAGTAYLTASYTRYDGTVVTNTCEVNVQAAPAQIVLTNSVSKIGYKETVYLQPIALDADGNQVEASFAYSSSASKNVSIKGTGIYGAAKGSANITVSTHNGVKLTIKVQTVDAPAKVSVYAEETAIGMNGSTRVITAFSSGQYGSVTWSSSNPEVLTVDENGVVVAKALGTSTVTARTFNGKTGSVTIRVLGEPTGVSFDVEEARVGEEGTKIIKAVLDENCAGRITYSSANPFVATVDKETGAVKGVRSGATTITATAINNVTGESFTASYQLTVTRKPVRFALQIGRQKIGLYETVNVEAVAYDEFGLVTEGGFSYASSNTTYVKVNAEGDLYGAKLGNADVTIKTYNGLSMKVRFTTVAAPTSVKVNTASVTMSEKDTAQLSYTTSSGSAGKVTWESSDLTVADIDEQGLVTAKGVGTAVITVKTYNGKAGYCTVVVKREPYDVQFDIEAEKVGEGNSRVITARIPDDCFGSIVYTSSDPEIASVDAATGKVSGLKAGTVSITAIVYDRNTEPATAHAASYELTVTPKPVKIVINVERTTIGVSEVMALNAVAYDANGNETDGGFTYTSSRTAYVKVNALGQVQGVAAGYSDITIKSYNGVALKGRINVVKAPSSIALNSGNVRISEIGSYQLTASLSSGSAGAYVWASSNPEIAEVDETGLVTAKAFGEARITATTYNGKSAACNVKVCYEPETVTFTQESAAVGERASITVTAVLGDDYIGNITYTSGNESIASVDPVTGKVTGMLAGETTIIATAHNNKENRDVTGVIKLTVTPAPARVEIISGRSTIGLKEIAVVNAVTYDASGNVIDGQLKLVSSNSTYITVNGMQMKGAKSGKATIGVVAYNGVMATMTVQVVNAPGSVNISRTDLTMVVGNEPVQILATLPSGTASAIVWETENADIAAIDENGYVTAVGYGLTRVRAVTFNGKYKICTVMVFEAPESVTMSEESFTMGVGQTHKLTAKPNDKAYQAVTYSTSNASVATVAEDGTVTAVGKGACTITAETFNGKKAVCAVTIKDQPSSIDIKLDNKAVTIGVKQSFDMSGLIVLSANSATSITYQTYDPSIATVDANGVIVGVKTGTTLVRATTHNGLSTQLAVVVQSAPTTVTLTVESKALYIGENTGYTVALPGGIIQEYVIFSSDPEVVAVDEQNAKLIAVSKGTAVITARSYNNISAAVTVEVLKHAESVSLDRTSAALQHYETLALTATVLPQDANNQAVIWSSSAPETVSVDEDGVISALAVTETPVIITAMTADGGFTATCSVTVAPIRAQGIALSTHELTLEKNRMYPLTVSFTPDNTDNRKVYWRSDNTSVATVDEFGVITAVADAGEAIITATSDDGSFTDTCAVTVTRVHVTGIALPEALEIIHCETMDISAVITPADAFVQSLEWTSERADVLSIDANGHMEALAVGASKVTATVTDAFGKVFTAVCSVTVLPIPVESVRLSLEDIELRVGDTAELTATVLPANAHDRSVAWTVDNGAVVNIEKDGENEHKAVISALAAGEAAITVTTTDGSLTAQCFVTVYDALVATATPNHEKNTVGNALSWTARAVNAIGEASYSIRVVHQQTAETVYDSNGFTPNNTATVENAAAGTYIATVTVKDGFGDTATCESTIVVAETQTFANGSELYTYVVMPGAMADGADGASIKAVHPESFGSTVIIPGYVDGIAVVRIDTEAFMGADALTSVSVPDTVTTIGARAFKDCASLTKMLSYTASK